MAAATIDLSAGLRPRYRPDFTSGLIPKKKDAKSGRDILHRSTDRASLVRQSKDHAQQFEDGLKAATRGIAGARFDAVRAEKDPERLNEKVNDEGQPIHTIPDILAGRISIDSPEAHVRTAESIRKHFDVIRDIDQFDKGDPDTGYRVHKMQVKVTPELSAEAHLVPREVLEANDRQHNVYEDARDAENDGKEGLAERKTKQAKSINDAAMEAFNARNEKNAEKATKYDFGNTQTPIPDESDAGKALAAVRAKIDLDDLNPSDFGDNSKGLETDPHVTVRYGIKGDDTAGIEKYLRSQAPFEAQLGKLSTFPANKNTDGAVVLKADVDAPELHRMNAEIENHGDFKESDFPDYKPHATVAYVKPEAAEKYVGDVATEGKTFQVRSVSISDRNGNTKEIPLEGGKFEGEGGRGESPEQIVAGEGSSKPATSSSDTSNDVEKEEFGPIHRQFHHDAKGAIDRLMADKTGEAVAALHHPEVGDIDLVYGKKGTPEKDYEDGYGLAKIAEKHPDVLSDLQGFVDALRVKSRSDNRIVLSDTKGRAVVRLSWNGAQKKWLLTAYLEKERPSAADGGRTGVTNRAESAPPANQGADVEQSLAKNEALRPSKITKGDFVMLSDDSTGTVAWTMGGKARVKMADGSRRDVPVKELKAAPATSTETPGPKWIGVDMDGTLAHYDGYKGPTDIGAPVPAMVERVKRWLKDGEHVKIFTARAKDPEAVKAIEAWSEQHLGKKLPVTNVKDDKMTQLWDDRAVQVGRNTGQLLGSFSQKNGVRRG